jgi:nucleoside-diphosphate-sugar epimerase
MTSHMPRIIVTGASSFIGWRLVRGLSSCDFDVLPLVRNSTGNERESLSRDLQNSDAVVHLFGLGVTESSEEKYSEDLNATKRLIDAAFVRSIRHFVLISFSVGYAASSSRFGTEEGVTPLTGKSEQEAEGHLRASGVPFTILRPSLEFSGTEASHLEKWATPQSPVSISDSRVRQAVEAVDHLCSAVSFVLFNLNAMNKMFKVGDEEGAASHRALSANLQAIGWSPSFALPSSRY